MKKTIVIFASVIFFLFLIFSSFKSDVIAVSLREGDFSRAEYVEDEIIVKLKGVPRFQRVRLSPQDKLKDVIERYQRRADVEYAEPNYIAHALMIPNDEYYRYQWHLDNSEYGGIHTEAAWDISSGSGVTVAIIDTGIAYEDYCEGSRWWKTCYEQAPDLANTCFVNGHDFVNNDNHPNDDSSPGHGTHVAGTVSQSTNNSIGVAGIAFNACLMPVKVLGSNGSGTYADVADGIYFSVDNGAQIINLSLGGTSNSQTLKDAVAYAYNHGVIVVAAAGNDGADTLIYPAAYDDYVIAVGATQYDESLAPYSNYGSNLDLVAPGGNNNLDQNNDGYADGVLQQTYEKSGWQNISWGYYFMQGTSMAAPHVSGTAALLLAHGNASTPDEIRTALQESADDLGASGRDNIYGWGLLNAASALAWTSGPIDNPPTVSITNPPDKATVTGTITITADVSDDVGVTQVDFYVDEVLIGSDSTAPYESVWDSTVVIDGDHVIKVMAIDTASQFSSDTVNVTVDNINDPPIADAGTDQTVSDADGTGLESVTLDGSDSYDSDGTIASYQWKEGETILGTTLIITYDFSVGIHTVTLTVTDDQGAVASDEVIVTVDPNQTPIANAGPDQSATVGQAVNFNGSDSSDSDGSIVSYDWDFGDGVSASGVTASYSYSTADTYTVILTVRDNGGLTNQDTAVITITEAPAQATMHIGDITFAADIRAWGRWGSWCRVTVQVPILDSSDLGIKEAAVYGNWSGAYNSDVSGSTNGEGVVSFRTNWVKGCGTFTFSVDNVTKDDWLYDPSANVETSDSITY